MVEDDNSTEEDDIFQFIGWLFHCGMAICFSRKPKRSYIDSAHCRVSPFLPWLLLVLFFLCFYIFPCPFVPCCCGCFPIKFGMFSHHHLLSGNAQGVGHSRNKHPPMVELMGDYFWECPALRVLPDVKCCGRGKKTSFLFLRYHAGISKNGMPSLLCIPFSKMPCEFFCSVMWPAIH